ncbi:MAG: bifunctional N-acetylglucosamine-1-phosphate uridyltransferase/glucosamine-1-phosphate acetyltransferase [Chloroflexota bacterium]|nr:bifunctional N-acetylglucosamine-1-phosphate uridyltransferase/glucosamine-1-phosphate acetyltransferase [Chloroflexota bacterium]
MTPITVPWTDVNSETATVVEWHVDDRSTIQVGSTLVDVETSKAALEIEAPASGLVLQMVPGGGSINVGEPIGFVFEDEAALAAFEADRARTAASAPDEAAGGQVTAKARQRAEELGVDLSTITASGLITVRDVEAAAGASAESVEVGELPLPLPGDPATQRLLVIGAGLGATQVADIVSGTPDQEVVAIVDDDRTHWGRTIRGVPVVGASAAIAPLWEQRAFDAAVISISTSVEARARLRALLESAGIPMANVIDRTAKVATGVRMGTGNVICAFVQLGTEAEIGSNNFISAFNSFEHHNVVGSDISTGPGCMTSGEVKLGDRVRLGAGIFVEPKLSLGDDVVVASGSIIVRSVPAGHAVKTKVVTTTVVPLRAKPQD